MNDKNLEESNRVADLYGRPLGLGVRVLIPKAQNNSWLCGITYATSHIDMVSKTSYLKTIHSQMIK